MGSRIKLDSKHIFDCFLEVAKPVDEDSDAFILQSYPSNYKEKDADKFKVVPKFTFPCKLEVTNVQHFSFVLTNQEASLTFGFCRIAPKAQTALVFLSTYPWHEAFYKILNQVTELISYHSQDELFRFLQASHTAKVPESGQVFHVSWMTDKSVTSDFTVNTPHHLNLPTLPENRNMNEYFNAVKANEMITIFASLLHERRIIVTSSRLSRLTACVQAANDLLYPMSWQHIFIPLLPKHMKDYLTAPMPFLVGVPSPIMERVRLDELGEVVILDADTGLITTPFDDVGDLPNEVKDTLLKGLKSKNLLGDALARTHLSAMVHLIGGYKDALKLRQGEKITFHEEAFLASRPPHMTPFLQQMLELQLFRQFVEERLSLRNSGKSLSDEFETEVLRYAERSPSSAKFHNMRREGGAFVKAVQKKANPAVKSAVRSVRESSKTISYKGKSAMRDMRSKLPNDVMRGRNGSQLPDEETKSAPSSPTMTGKRHYDISNAISGGGGLIRNSTDLNLKARVLKYEKFEPPPVSNLSSTSLSKSPEFDALPDLNMDLMSEMHDVINRKPSPYHMQPPKVNRQGDSPELDLIALGCNGNNSEEDENQIIFDPLLAKDGAISPQNFQTSSMHRPLQRSSITSSLAPPQANHYGNHPVSSTSRPLSSNSSEDLLKEYGLDFSTLSFPRQQNFYQHPVVSNGPPTNPQIFYQHPVINTLPNPPMMFPTNSQNSPSLVNNVSNLLDDLDPLRTTTPQRPPGVGVGGVAPPTMTLHNTPTPPMAPPRTKKSVSQNWTTFE